MADEKGWLIERAPNGVTEWLTLEFGEVLWTTNSNEALRFGREIDARRYFEAASNDIPSFARITEHVWLDPTSRYSHAQPAPSQTKQD